MNKIILHCDLNNFYASVECVKNPALKNKPVVVCGSYDDRHGIVLAKSQKAKLCGVKTGDTLFEARRKCGELNVTLPDFDSYYTYSQAVRGIYSQYTDLIEPFGMDECWLDVSGSTFIFGDGEKIANDIRNHIRRETGLTISVGVSFNKIFAKLGSDMKKPDVTTIISKENFKEKIWCLPSSDLLFVGRQTKKNLEKYGIRTIGDIAKSDGSFMRKILGKNGYDLWLYANGLDNSPVSYIGTKPIVKSVSRGITCVESLLSVYEVARVISELSVSVSKELHREGLCATGIQIAIREENLTVKQYAAPIGFPTCSAKDIYENAVILLFNKHQWKNNVRSVTVRTFNLVFAEDFQQLTVDFDIDYHTKTEAADNTVRIIREKEGRDVLFNGCRLFGTKMPTGKAEFSSLPPSGSNF